MRLKLHSVLYIYPMKLYPPEVEQYLQRSLVNCLRCNDI